MTTPSIDLYEFSIDELPPGVHQDLYERWCAKKTQDHLPSRADFDPLAMPTLLPHITIFDVERTPLRFCIRLVGTAIVDAMGIDTTGRYLDQLDNVDAIVERAKTMAETGAPYSLSNLPLTWTHRTYKTYSVLGLPLATDGKTVDKLLYSMVFE